MSDQDPVLYVGELVEIHVSAEFNSKATNRYKAEVSAFDTAAVRVELEAQFEGTDWRKMSETAVFPWGQIKRIIIEG